VLRSVAWCDEIVVLDKSSTDRTREIASRYARVITIPHTEWSALEYRRLRDESTSEWILTVTCSALVTPALADEVRRLIANAGFPYDIIEVPFRRFVLGFDGPHSPWCSGSEAAIARRSVLQYREDEVHAVISFTSDRRYRIEGPEGACLYHLTHSDVDGMMERHVRYCRAEGRLSAHRITPRRAARSVLRAVFDVIFRRRTWRLGWDGVALAFAWVSYWMLRYIYIWEQHRNTRDVYEPIVREVMAEWKDRS
jgi:hypothetical protein